MDVVLVMFKADGTRRDFPIRQRKVVLGRTNTCDLRIPLSSVSREHCEIIVGDDEITVRDLGSSNGSFVNNDRIQEAKLSPGDELVIGPVVFTVVVGGQPSEIEPVRSLINSANGGATVVTEKQDQENAAADGIDKTAAESGGSASGSSLNPDDSMSVLESMSDDSDISGDLPMLKEDDEETETS